MMAVMNVKSIGNKFKRIIHVATAGRPMYRSGSKNRRAWHVRWTRDTSRLDAFTTAVPEYFPKTAMMNRTKTRPRNENTSATMEKGDCHLRKSSSTFTHAVLSLFEMYPSSQDSQATLPEIKE
jgi:hypothetical protein